jgi:hypothetical protein
MNRDMVRNYSLQQMCWRGFADNSLQDIFFPDRQGLLSAGKSSISPGAGIGKRKADINGRFWWWSWRGIDRTSQRIGHPVRSAIYKLPYPDNSLNHANRHDMKI